MITYRQIFKDKPMTEEVSERISEIMEHHAGDNEHMKYELAYALHGGHLCEYTADYRIRHMQAVAYIGEDKSLMHNVRSMHDYLSEMGISPDSTQACNGSMRKSKGKG